MAFNVAASRLLEPSLDTPRRRKLPATMRDKQFKGPLLLKRFESDQPPSEDSNSKVMRRGRGAQRRTRMCMRDEWQKIILSNYRTVCAGSGESEHCRMFKVMNSLSAHRSSNPRREGAA